MKISSPLPFVLAMSFALGACGGSSGNTNPGKDSGGGGRDAGHEASVHPDAGTDSQASGYPAFPVDYPQILKNQGTVLTKPVIVTISWPGDSNASTWEGFGDAIGASTYWSATTAQYGVGAATSGASDHIRMTEPLGASLSYTQLQSYVQAAITDAMSGGGDAGGPQWPAPMTAGGDVQTIYSLFIANSTAVTDPGTGASFCTEGGLGYHDDVVVGGQPVAYSVSLECTGQSLADIEETAAHEYVEAATNPYTETTSLGYVGFDQDHFSWDLYQGFNTGDELADACQNWQDSYFEETGTFPYWVQRSWSNEAAPLGHDPCAPPPSGPYHGMTLFPAEESTVTVNLNAILGTTEKTHGFTVSIGTPLTFEVGFYSDAPAPPWTISYDFPATTQLYNMTTGNPIGNGAAKVTIDKTMGQNGDKATVTVTTTTKGDSGFHIMAITWDPPSSMDFLPHYLPIVLVDE